MPVTLPGPVPQVVDDLAGRRRVEAAQHVVASHDAQHLRIDQVRRGVIGIDHESRPNLLGLPSVGEHLVRAEAWSTGIGQGPRSSSNPSITSARVRPDGRRRVRVSHSSTVGREARRAASRLEQVGNGDAGLRCAASKGRIHLVVDVADLDGLRHRRIITCAYAPLLLGGLEVERERVDAVAEPRRLRAVREHVAEV